MRDFFLCLYAVGRTWALVKWWDGHQRSAKACHERCLVSTKLLYRHFRGYLSLLNRLLIDESGLLLLLLFHSLIVFSGVLLQLLLC